jgi:hypothetical protein
MGDRKEVYHVQWSSRKAPVYVKVVGKDSMVVQTHDNVTVGADKSSISSMWVKLDGFSKASCICKGDGTHQMSMSIAWYLSNNNPSFLFEEAITSVQNVPGQAVVIDVKAPYAKLKVVNKDTANAHVMNAWMYLKE